MMSEELLLPGLVDNHTEYFNHHDKSLQVKSGSVHIISDLPTGFKNLIKQAIHEDRFAQRGLDKIGITEENERVQKYYSCNYSSCDQHPDVTDCGKLGPREYIPCPNRGNCEAEGMLCKIPFGLSIRQRDVVREIGFGLLDKEICAKLGISQDTLRNHKDHAAAKAGIERKTSLGIIAHQYKLL